MPALQDQFIQLPHLYWRTEDLTLPVAERGHRFAHEGTDHQVIYRNGVAVEMTGSGARIFSYTIPFREGITSGPYFQLFSVKLLRFYRAYHDDKSPGILYDPIYGEVTCVPQEWDETTDVNRRDGVDVRVSFKEHVPISGTEETAQSTLDSLTGEAKRLDDEVAKVDWETQQPPPNAAADPLAIASGLIQQGNFAVSRVKSRVHEVAMRMNEIEESAAEAEENGIVGAGLIRNSARRGRLHATKVAEAPPRDMISELVQVILDTPSDLFALANDLGLTLQELLYLNPGLSRSPNVDRNTVIWTRRRR